MTKSTTARKPNQKLTFMSTALPRHDPLQEEMPPLRLLFDLAGPPAWWWGAVLMLLGALSAVLGLLYALLQTDLKRFLAYSTVENLGLIYIALGFALAFDANGLPAAAAIAPAVTGGRVGGGVVFQGSSSMSRRSVSVAPGITSTTLTGVSASSRRSDRVACASAAFDAA